MLIKVCGMRHPENIRRVADSGADWLGFIFYARSPRRLESDDSGQSTATYPKSADNGDGIRQAVLGCRLKKVGVFVDADPEYMTETAERYGLDYLQLHGHESPDTCRTLRERGYAIIKAFPMADEEDLKTTADYESRADYFLFDTKCSGYGGSGRRFDWSVLSGYKGRTPFLLGGGIAPDSVEAVRNFRHPKLAGIDLNSGFETAPGIKDAEKLKTFIDKIKK